MNLRSFLLLDVLLVFLALTVYVIETVGYVGFFREILSTPAGMLAALDLTIALSLALVWMRGDVKTSGVPFAPYLLVTLTIGVAGPLGYLLHRELRERRSVAARSVAAA